ncbi:MAG: hypothetical protein KAG97_10770, partial [Victivallales bacterium]|nr:hypothetical protein [Victivallales bacterium]
FACLAVVPQSRDKGVRFQFLIYPFQLNPRPQHSLKISLKRFKNGLTFLFSRGKVPLLNEN